MVETFFRFYKHLMVFDVALWIRIDTLRAGPNYQTPFSGINIDLSNPSAEDCKSLRKFQKFQKRFILWPRPNTLQNLYSVE